jgi:hypothetical protein
MIALCPIKQILTMSEWAGLDLCQKAEKRFRDFTLRARHGKGLIIESSHSPRQNREPRYINDVGVSLCLKSPDGVEKWRRKYF